jgi:anthrone oxygenase-like protein
MDFTRKVFVCLAITFAAGLLFANVYNSVVDVPNWGGNIPQSIEASRAYFKFSNPGTFYRTLSPAAQIINLLALILCWTADRRVRYLLLAAFLLSVGADALTFGYFYPRNKILFIDPIEGNLDSIRAAYSQWATVNWVRSAIVVLGLILNFAALDRLIGLRRDN